MNANLPRAVTVPSLTNVDAARAEILLEHVSLSRELDMFLHDIEQLVGDDGRRGYALGRIRDLFDDIRAEDAADIVAVDTWLGAEAAALAGEGPLSIATATLDTALRMHAATRPVTRRAANQ
ncbi:MAG TPA: hypothetical protein VHD87_13015 [Acidimicrobiales bacterium]|nr:hypothetical protein [Acidimicrobiales bacterium]